MSARRITLPLVLALTLTACPRKPPEVGPARPERAPDGAALIPSGAVAVGYLDAPTLLGRPAIKEESALVQQLVERVRKEFGIDPSLLREATLFSAPGTEKPGIAVAGMALSLGAIVPASLRGSPGLATVGAPVDHEGRAIYALGGGVRVAFLRRATVLGDEASLRAALDVASRKRPGLARDDELLKLLQTFDGYPFRIAVRVAGFRSLLEKLPLPAEIKAVPAAAFGVDVGTTDVRGQISLVAGEPEKLAAQISASVKDLADKLRKSSFLRMFGDLLAGVEVQPGPGQVTLSAKIPLAIARGLLPILLGAWRMN